MPVRQTRIGDSSQKDNPMNNPFADDEAIDDLGRYIKAQRELAQLSVRHLARIAQVSDSYLSQVEKGRYQPSAQFLSNIAKGLNMQPDVFFKMAGWLPTVQPDDQSDAVEAALRADSRLSDEQRSLLLQLYKSMVNPT
jgi:transcriptional regulator with XRE-family HTH domain